MPSGYSPRRGTIERSARLKPALLFVVGASGAGKTAAVAAINARQISGVRCYHFDSIGVPTPAEMDRQWGSGEKWQEAMTKQWIERIAANPDRCDVALLEGQTRPSFITPYSAARILLLDCTPAVRLTRLRDMRGQPELAGERMDTWAVYLRGQADALSIRVVDTSEMSVEAVGDVLEEELENLRS